jgi:hypothetical protein
MLENVLVSLHSLKRMGRGPFGVSAHYLVVVLNEQMFEKLYDDGYRLDAK